MTVSPSARPDPGRPSMPAVRQPGTQKAPAGDRGLATAAPSSARPSERDVVFAGAAASAGGRGRRGLQGALVHGDVAAGLEAVPAAAALLAAAEELDGVGDDVDALALVAVLVLPLAPLETPVDRHGAALAQVARAVLALRAPHGDVEVVRLVDPFAGAVVLATGVHGDAEAAHRGPARRRAQLGVAREVAGDDDPVDVGGCHVRCSFRAEVRCRARPQGRAANV